MTDHIGDANKMIGGNHLPDTGKMVSSTPRTDAVMEYDDTTVDDAKGFARELERELNAANSEVERLTRKVTELYEGAEEQKQRIKRLEDENDAMRADLLLWQEQEMKP